MNKLQVLDNLRIKGIFTILGLSFTLLLSSLLIFGAYNTSQIIGHITLVLFFIPHFFIFKNMNFSNGRMHFIDLDNNTLYIVKSGILSIQHKKVHFTNIKNLRAKMLIQKIGKLWSTSYEIRAEIDGEDKLLCTTSSRVKCNGVINSLSNHYSLSCDFKIEGKVSKFHKGIFQNTMYKYKYAPQSYSYSAILMLFSSCVFFLTDNNFSAFIMLIGCMYSFVLYNRSKLNLEEQAI